MKYCIPYFVGCKYLNQADEISIIYKDNLVAFIDLLKTHQNQRIVVEVEKFDKEELDFFISAREQYDNFTIKLSYMSTKQDIIEELEIKHIPFFFQEYCSDWSAFNLFLQYEVTDIFIANDLGFELKKIADIAHNKGIKIRVHPDVAQAVFSKCEDITKFFIRPEDIPFYENYVDICEFFADAPQSDVLYQIYAIDKKWGGLLKFIIKNFEDNVPNPFLGKEFAKKRVFCEKRCLKEKLCRSCPNALGIAKTITKIRLSQLKKNN